MTSSKMLDFYREPGPMTSAGEYTEVLNSLPADSERLAAVIQGLLLHEHWAPTYGQVLSDERRSDTHNRSAATILERVCAVDGRPLGEPRPLEARIVGTCRNFTLLMVAIMRARGVPARARCGFANYFVDGLNVDHWVAEIWSDEEQRWKLVDPQIDDFQLGHLSIDFDLLDVPRDRFLVAGDAWKRCRAGDADPATFGIMDMHGMWFIGGNVMRDLASLNKVEMLPWDDWGAMPRPDQAISDDRLPFWDDLAELTSHPDEHFDQLRARYADDHLSVPPVVYNAVLQRPEQ